MPDSPPPSPDLSGTLPASTQTPVNGGPKPTVRVSLKPAASPVPPSGAAPGPGPGGPSGGGDSGNGGGGDGDGPADSTPPGGDAGNIQDLLIERELQDSYLTYAMSTIMDRALPDVRDGLKPSQRRILVAMNDLNLRPGKKHLKCAKIAGDTSGNYHPHGESVIYPTLVNMGQNWRMRTTLIDPQGNFGSIAPDPPAAMRYTEARMTQAAVDLLDDLKLDTVDLQPNYDDRLMEPTVLPGKFPNLLINGGVGIAVGMATSLAPHNPAEIFDAIVRVLERPDIPLQELMQDHVEDGKLVRLGVKGPDFPTGGLLLGRSGIVEAYATGRGKVTLRGRVRSEPIPGSKDRHQLVIEQIPYNLGLKTLIESVSAAIEADRIVDISDARDESSSKSPVRVVIELKKGADPAVVEKQLYEYTPLQQTFSIQNIALVNRQPRTLSLIELIKYYIEHRVVVIRRRTAHLLGEAKKRAHRLEGMIFAVCDIDEVVRLIRSSRTRAEAIDKLAARAFRIPDTHPFAPKIPARLLDQVRRAEAGGSGGVNLTRVQAEAICDMRLSQLVGLEIERLVEEYRQVVAQIEDFEDILARPERVAAMIKADCDEMKARYTAAKFPMEAKTSLCERRTEIQDAGEDDAFSIAALIQVEDMAVTISHQGYAKRVKLNTYKQQGRGGKGIIGGATKEDDFIEHMFVASTHDDLLCFTNTGRVFKIKVYELPELPRTSKGRAIVNLIDLREGETVRGFLPVKNFEEGSHYLFFVSAQGIVKRTPLKDYRNVNKSGLIAVGLKDGDRLLDCVLTTGSDDILLATAQGMSIRFNEDDARAMGRSAAGVKGIELEDSDEVIGVVAIPMRGSPDEDRRSWDTVDPSVCLLTISERGYGKRTPVDEYRVQPETGKPRSQSRGGKGRVDIDASQRNGRSIAAIGVRASDDVVVTTRNGMTVRMPVAEIRETGRGTQGVRVVKVEDADSVVAAAPVPAGE